MECHFKPSAFKELQKLPKDIQERIIKKLDFYTNSANPLKFAKSLAEKERLGDYCFRIGDWRVIFDLNNNKIIVLLIGHRKDIYK